MSLSFQSSQTVANYNLVSITAFPDAVVTTITDSANNKYVEIGNLTRPGASEITYDAGPIVASPSGNTVSVGLSTAAQWCHLGIHCAVRIGKIKDTPDGYIVEIGFEYGLTTAYGSMVSAQVPTDGSFGLGEFAEEISGLQLEALYKNASGSTAYSVDPTFTTKPQ